MFPSVQEYLALLPDGLDSHPQCRSKASLYRSVLANRSGVDDLVDGLPDAIRSLALRPPPVNAWVPEVHSHAIMLGTYDAWFDSRDEYMRHAYTVQRRLFEGPLYSVLFRVATPRLLMRGASLRWRAFHRGSEINVKFIRDNAATVELVCPPNVWDPIAAEALGEAFRALLDLTGAKRTSVRIATDPHGHLEYTAAWQ